MKTTADALRKDFSAFLHIAPGHTAPTNGQYETEHKIGTYGGLY